MSPKLRSISAIDLVKALKRDGFILKRQHGSHRIYLNPSNNRQVIVPYHHAGESLRIGTLTKLINDAGWTDDDLIRLGLMKK
ncbi:TPA: type II toxin-antitoxin system HicA family toxin [Candidatus Poribacteria bacterium]|nr:type II toxin-antitoxin system HicA family toxin [Candidatus Poribacteria bacterium]